MAMPLPPIAFMVSTNSGFSHHADLHALQVGGLRHRLVE